MRKKTLSVVLGAAMAASLLSGCGGASKPADARLTQRLLQPIQHLPMT